MSSSGKGYQDNYSDIYAHKIEYDESRDIKAEKTMSILRDYLQADTQTLTALEVGCYKGTISMLLSPNFKAYYAVDIDQKAIDIAKANYSADNLFFEVGNGQELRFEDNSMDVVICSHVYEHVPDPVELFKEIKRVMKPGGCCYFAAGNKIRIMEPHFHLPFLSLLPKPLAHLYMRITGKGKFYYEELKTLWGLKTLTKDFARHDYTVRVIEEPEKFSATDMLTQGSRKQKIFLFILKKFYFLSPTYLWLLSKSK